MKQEKLELIEEYVDYLESFAKSHSRVPLDLIEVSTHLRITKKFQKELKKMSKPAKGENKKTRGKTKRYRLNYNKILSKGKWI